MPFGKHKGALVDELPSGYLDWLSDLPDLREPLFSEVMEEISVRAFLRVQFSKNARGAVVFASALQDAA